MNVRQVDETTRHGATPALREVAGALARRPRSWWRALPVAVRLAPNGWWRRPPFLPLPDERYWKFRMQTAYGDEDAVPSARDVDDLIRWSRRTRSAQR